MLVLSRKSRESVVIGGTDGFHRLLRVTVLDVRGSIVKLGFEADSDVPVHRAEVWERIRASGGPDRLSRQAACEMPEMEGQMHG
ncbi:MAG: carbon storage regulator [Pirellulales bacterium]|nr:carbon storage regulator [Pirellulales bacterium]